MLIDENETYKCSFVFGNWMYTVDNLKNEANIDMVKMEMNISPSSYIKSRSKLPYLTTRVKALKLLRKKRKRKEV